MALAAGFTGADIAAEISAMWMGEGGLDPKTRELVLRPGGDAGPAQLTSWWRNNKPELIVGNAYGSWHGRTATPFDGSVEDNIATLRNINEFNKQLHGSFHKAAYWYGPGDYKNPGYARGTGKDHEIRKRYADEKVNYYNQLKPFFDCLKQ